MKSYVKSNKPADEGYLEMSSNNKGERFVTFKTEIKSVQGEECTVVDQEGNEYQMPMKEILELN